MERAAVVINRCSFSQLWTSFAFKGTRSKLSITQPNSTAETRRCVLHQSHSLEQRNYSVSTSVFDHFKTFAAMCVISGSGWKGHYDTHTHTNKIKPIKDNLWPHSEHLAIHGRCSLCIGCVTVSPNIVNMCSVSAQSMSTTHWWMRGGGGGAVDVVFYFLSKNWKTAFTYRSVTAAQSRAK